MDKTDIVLRLKEVKKELAKINYYDYVSYVHNDYIYTNHAKFMCDTLSEAIENKKLMLEGKLPKENQYIAISMPPRHGKSMNITETLPSYYLGQFPEHRVIECSYNTTFATKFGKKNRQKVEQFGKDLFDIEISRDSSSSTDWDIEGHNGGMISRGILAGVTGEGADLMIIDDPVKNREEANSEVYREKLWNEWIDTLSTRLHPCAIVIIILTRWHEDDLIGRLLNKEYAEPLPWNVINLALEAEENDPMKRKIGEPLWPERYGYDFIKQRKMYPQSFNSLYQGRPTAQEGNMLKKYWWGYWKPKGIDLPPITVRLADGSIKNIYAIDLPDKFDRQLQSWDMTFKDSDGTDFVAAGTWGSYGADIFYLDQMNERMDFPTTLDAVQKFSDKWPKAITKLIEDKANGPAVIAMLRHKLPGILAVQPDGSKIARVSAVSEIIESGNVYLPHPHIAPWINEFLAQASAFPNATHDDLVDQMSQALKRFMYIREHEKKDEIPKDIPDDLKQDLENDPEALKHYLATH